MLEIRNYFKMTITEVQEKKITTEQTNWSDFLGAQKSVYKASLFRNYSMLQNDWSAKYWNWLAFFGISDPGKEHR